MVKLLTLNRDMRPDGLGGLGGVTFLQRNHNLFVFLHGLLQAAPETQLSSAKRLKPTLQTKAFLFEEAVSRFPVQDRVELLIFPVVLLWILLLDSGVTSLVRVFQFIDCLVGYTVRCEARGSCFKLRHDLKHLHQSDGAGLFNEHASPGAMFDQSGLGKSKQSFSDRRPRYSEPFCQLNFVQAFLIAKCAIENQLFDLVGDYI